VPTEMTDPRAYDGGGSGGGSGSKIFSGEQTWVFCFA